MASSHLVDLLRADFARLHKLYDRATADLTPEQWHAVPGPKANHIAFTVLHWVRTEDNIIRLILQGRPTVWVEGGWPERLSLPPRFYGTGVPTEEAQALRIGDLAAFHRYIEDVQAAAEGFLATADDGVLAKEVTVKPLGQMSGAQALWRVCLTHGFTHFGEIELTRVLLGLPTASRA